MSDLLAASQPGGSRSNGNGSGTGTSVTAPRGQTGSPSIKGPREVMRERNAREARRKAEQEALERTRAEAEARALQEEKRKSAERRAIAAGMGSVPMTTPGRSSQAQEAAGTQRPSEPSQRSDRRAERTSGDDRLAARSDDPTLQGRGTGGRAVGGGDAPTNVRRRPTQSQTAPQLGTQPQPQPQSQMLPQGKPVERERQAPPPAQPVPGRFVPPIQEQQSPNQLRSGFPHAFERWETLSAHWEGLTSYWVRRLQENAHEINRDPISAQLARQNTDLSAAGANLFHAVVELQRLRASSERKFQRWFFDTRAELERGAELQAITENALLEERAMREQLVAQRVEEALAAQRANVTVDPNAEKHLAEQKRELEISKQEARRAWDELGRREAEERARTLSLREGLPTLVGGVQVVPMMQGVPSQRNSNGNPVSQQPMDVDDDDDAVMAEKQPEMQQYQGPDFTEAYAEYESARKQAQDPFVESANEAPRRPAGRPRAESRSTPSTTHSPPYTPVQAPAVQQPTSAAFYQQPMGTALHPSDPNRVSDIYSEEEYEIDPQGHFRRDSRGHKILYQGGAADATVSDEDDDREEADDDDVSMEDERTARARQYMHRQNQQATSGGAAYHHPSSSTTMGMSAAPAAYSTMLPPPPTSTSAGQGMPMHAPTAPGPIVTADAIPATTSATVSPLLDEDPDYEGEGYGSGPGWEAVPRHHHPTRLSDVLEEDENSRTSASQAGRER